MASTLRAAITEISHAKSTKPSVNRRGFLKGAAAGAAAIAAQPETAKAQDSGSAPRGTAGPTGAQVAREAGRVTRSYDTRPVRVAWRPDQEYEINPQLPSQEDP